MKTVKSLNLTPVLDCRTGSGYVYHDFKVESFTRKNGVLLACVDCHGSKSHEVVERRRGRLVVVVR